MEIPVLDIMEFPLPSLKTAVRRIEVCQIIEEFD